MWQPPAFLDQSFDPSEHADLLGPTGLTLLLRDAVARRDLEFVERVASCRVAQSIDGPHVRGCTPRDRWQWLTGRACEALTAQSGVFTADEGSVEAAEMRAFLGGDPIATRRRLVRVPIVLVAGSSMRGHDGGGAAALAYLCLDELDLPPGDRNEGTFAHDRIAAPFQRVDPTFHGALLDAWHAAVSGSRLAVRWRVVNAAGQVVEALAGPSVGLGAAVGLRVLVEGRTSPNASRWVFTGAISTDGAVRTLLAPGTHGADYSAKLAVLHGRALFVPLADVDNVSELSSLDHEAPRVVGVADLDDVMRRLVAEDSGSWWAPWTARPFTGRSSELGVLLQAWADADNAGPVVTVLTGESGIGKSHLLAEFAMRCSDGGGLVLRGSAHVHPSLELQPVVDAFASLARSTDTAELRRILGDQVSDVARFMREFAESGDDGRRVVHLGASDAVLLLTRALCRWLHAIQRRRATVLILDDAQWMTPLTVQALLNLLAAANGLRLLVVVAVRSGEALREEAAGLLHDVARYPATRGIALEGLTRHATADLVQRTSPQRTADDAVRLADTLWSCTGGHPFIMAEILRQPDVLGCFEDPSGELARPVLARAAQLLVEPRLRALTPDARKLLRVSAVAASSAGLEFDLSVTGRAAGLDEGRTVAAIEEAITAGLVVELDPSSDTLRFTHDAVARALRDHSRGLVRRRLHRAVAQVIEQQIVPSADAVCELAYHFGEATGLDCGEVAVRYGCAAAEHHGRHYAHGLAAQALRRALRAGNEASASLPGWERRSVELLIDLGEHLNHAGDQPAARDVLTGAGLRAETHGFVDLRARAAVAYGGHIAVGAEDDELAVSRLLSAHEALGGSYPEHQVLVLCRLARWRYHHGTDSERRAWLDQASVLAEALDDDELRATVLDNRSWALYGPYNTTERYRTGLVLARLGRRQGRPDRELDGIQTALHAALELGRPSAIRRFTRRRNDLAHQVRLPYYEWGAAVHDGLDAALRGDFGRAETLAHQARRMALGLGDADVKIVMAAQLVMIRWLQGRLAEEVDYTSRACNRQPGRMLWRTALAWFAGQAGDLQLCERTLHDLGGVLAVERVQPNFEFWSNMVGLAHAAVAVHDVQLASAIIERLEPFEERFCMVGQSANYGAVAMHLGRLAWVTGDTERAIHWLRLADRRAEELGAPALYERSHDALVAALGASVA